ncbi:MAG: GspE/PulE/PilB domain-containing protein [Deltaproteobacteria bacterium]
MAIEIGSWMLKQNLLGEGQLRQARDVQMQKGGELGRLVVDMGLVDEKRLAASLSQAFGLPKVDLGKVVPDAETLAKVPRRLAQNLAAFPCVLRDSGRTLWLAMANPLDENAKAALERASKCALKVTVAGYREIEQAIEKHYAWGEDAEELGMDMDDDGPVKITDMSGKTMITFAPTAPPVAAAPPPPPAPAQGDEVDPLDPFAIAPGPRSSPYGLGPDELKLLQMLQEGLGKSAQALQVILELCEERGVMTRAELSARLKH